MKDGSDEFEHFDLGSFDYCDDLVPFHRREAMKEIFDRFTAFQIINQILEGDTRADKHGRPTHDVWDRMHNAFEVFACHSNKIAVRVR